MSIPKSYKHRIQVDPEQDLTQTTFLRPGRNRSSAETPAHAQFLLLYAPNDAILCLIELLQTTVESYSEATDNYLSRLLSTVAWYAAYRI